MYGALIAFAILNCFLFSFILDDYNLSKLKKYIGLVLMAAITFLIKPVGLILGIISLSTITAILFYGVYKHARIAVKRKYIRTKIKYVFVSLYFLIIACLFGMMLMEIPKNWHIYSPLLSF